MERCGYPAMCDAKSPDFYSPTGVRHLPSG